VTTTTTDNAALYAQREQRFNDIVALRKPDKVPFLPLMMHYFPNKIAGVSNAAVQADHFLMTKYMKEATLKFGFEWAAAVGVPPTKSLEALQVKQIRWPGGDLPDEAPFQWVEGEYIQADEVDLFLADPPGFSNRTLLPRIAGALSPLAYFQLPPVHWLANGYSTILMAPFLSMPGVKEMFEAMVKFADDAQNYMAAEGAYWAEMAALGYPQPFVGVGFPAFDLVSDYFRSLRGSTLDMYRQPEKLLAMIDVMTPASIGLIIGACKATNTTRAFIPMHRGAGGFMSEEQFEKFYWPSFSALIYACIEAGITPMPLFEGDYTPRLKYLATLPPGKVAAHMDKVDRHKFKEICGDVMCFWGNVQASLMVAGTPQQVKDDVKELIDIFGDRLMVDSNMGIPDEARPENVLALREAVDDYGVL
jgi:hypothetical protein